MAVQRDVPVLSVFAMKVGRREYKVFLDVLPVSDAASKQERIQALADAYAARLEAIVRAYPDQWYNFFDFWK